VAFRSPGAPKALRLSARACLALALLVLGCGSPTARFPLKEPLWRDPDRHSFKTPPEEYFSPFAWDGADQLVFRPISRFFAVDPLGEASNVNSFDEVPDSSWFTNRIGLPLARGKPAPTLQAFARGPCVTQPLDTNGPWTVTGAKPNGFNPGFIIKAANGLRYLIKFDGLAQGVRPTAADVIGSRIYHAAGFFTPCNRVVYFDRSILNIDPKARGEDADGDDEPLTQAHLDVVFSKAQVLPDGRYRAASSLFVDGKPLGPWTYQGRRADDPNDVVDHEMRRELRGAYVLAAWTNHFDSREQNTLSAWVESARQPDRGYLRHYYIDFGDCFGSIWEPPLLGRRIGSAYYFDVPYLLEDFVTLGIPQRPWDTARLGKSGAVFGYYDVKHFRPDMYRPGYPNPPFSAMTERDAAWMARILSRFSDRHVAALVNSADLRSELLVSELTRILIGRRDKLLKRYLGRLSPLANPRIDTGVLCLDDAAVSAGIAAPTRGYIAQGYAGDALTPKHVAVQPRAGGVCVALPAPSPGASQEYWVVDIAARKDAAARADAISRAAIDGLSLYPTRVHLMALRSGSYRVVGVERPESHAPPAE